MHSGLAFGIGLSVAVVGGVALWPDASHAASHAARSPGHRSLLVTAMTPSAGPRGSEEVLAKALLALLSADQLQRAVVVGSVGPGLCLARSVPPAVITNGRGVMAEELPAPAAALFWRLMQHGATTLPSERAADDLQRAVAAGSSSVAFAFGGDRSLGGASYVRLHGPHFVFEWLRAADGQEHRRWRDFDVDAKLPWLRDELSRGR